MADSLSRPQCVNFSIISWSCLRFGAVSSRITVSYWESDVDRKLRRKHNKSVTINAIQVYHDVIGKDYFHELFNIFQVTEIVGILKTVLISVVLNHF